MLLTSASRFGRVSDLLRPAHQRFRTREQPGCNRPALIPIRRPSSGMPRSVRLCVNSGNGRAPDVDPVAGRPENPGPVCRIKRSLFVEVEKALEEI